MLSPLQIKKIARIMDYVEKNYLEKGWTEEKFETIDNLLYYEDGEGIEVVELHIAIRKEQNENNPDMEIAALVDYIDFRAGIERNGKLLI